MKPRYLLIYLILAPVLALSFLSSVSAASSVVFSPKNVFVKPGDTSSKTISVSLSEKPTKDISIAFSQAYNGTVSGGASYVNIAGLPKTITFTPNSYQNKQLSYSVNGSYKKNDFNLVVAEGKDSSGSRVAGSFGITIGEGPAGREVGSTTTNPSNLDLSYSDTQKKMVGLTLSKDPQGSITIKVTQPTDNSGAIALGKREFTFNSSNYSTPQEFGVTVNASNKTRESELIIFEGSNDKTYFTGSMGVRVGGVIDANFTNNSIPIDPIQAEDLPGSGLNLDGAVGMIIRGFLTLIAVAAFASLIYSGFMYITSSGDASKTEKARKNITWAITGIFIALISYMLVRLAADPTGTLNFFNQQSTSNGSTSATEGSTSSGSALLTDSSGSSAAAEYSFRGADLGESIPFYVGHSKDPGKTVNFTVEAQGNLPITISTASFAVTSQSWQEKQAVFVTYNGDGKAGDQARIVVKSDNGDRFTVSFRVPSDTL
jgi:hypothetical protein